MLMKLFFFSCTKRAARIAIQILTGRKLGNKINENVQRYDSPTFVLIKNVFCNGHNNFAWMPICVIETLPLKVARSSVKFVARATITRDGKTITCYVISQFDLIAMHAE